jgi:hypothetical protein
MIIIMLTIISSSITPSAGLFFNVSCLCPQATSMAYHDITEESVYLCSGNPLPADVDAITDALFNDTFKVMMMRRRRRVMVMMMTRM